MLLVITSVFLLTSSVGRLGGGNSCGALLFVLVNGITALLTCIKLVSKNFPEFFNNDYD